MKYKFEIEVSPEETEEMISRLGMMWWKEWVKLFMMPMESK